LASLGHNWTEKLFRDQHMSCFSIITLWWRSEKFHSKSQLCGKYEHRKGQIF
jgi:hypothetical protein